MVVLLTGASGFIGEHLAPALRAAGHRVIAAVHGDHSEADAVAVDYTRDFDPTVWKPRLEGIDAVINAVGILRERGAETFDALHVRAPRALFAAAAELGVRRVVQFSALDADDEAQSPYHSSKHRVDDFLSSLPLSSVVVQPSLVYGAGGSSAALFDTPASLPMVPVPAGGLQRVRPVHVDDVVAAVVALLGIDSWRVGRMAAYPVAASVALLGRVEVSATLAPTVLAVAAAMDIALGIATLVARSRWLWRIQIAIIVAYTAIISVGLSELWADPFGPVLKNLPILAALLLLLQLEDR